MFVLKVKKRDRGGIISETDFIWCKRLFRKKRKKKNLKKRKTKNSSFKPIFVFSSRIHVIYWSYFGFCVKSMCFIGVFISISGIRLCFLACVGFNL